MRMRAVVVAVALAASIPGCEADKTGFGSAGDTAASMTVTVGDGSDDGGGETGSEWDVPRCTAYQIHEGSLTMNSSGLEAECDGDQRQNGGTVHRAEASVCEFGGAVCVNDGECAAQEVCLCHSGFTSGGVPTSFSLVIEQTICYPSDCTTDADCGDELCGLAFDQCRVPVGVFCLTADDECKRDADCEGAGSGDHCQYSAADAKWVCASYDDAAC